MPLCLAAGAVTAALAAESFTLAWTHSIEKVRWEEDWHIANRMLVITEARIRGTGAGMEPPPDAVLRDGAWHYRPKLAPQTQVRLAHSPYTVGYQFCIDGRCRPLADHLPGAENPSTIVLEACP
jgi:hypothetical protein